MLDIDDCNSSSADSTITMLSGDMSENGNGDTELSKYSKLDEALEALYEKKASGSIRAKALVSFIEAFSNRVQNRFVEKNCVTLLHPCLYSLKKGSNREISLASRTIGLLALTVGQGDNAREILTESVVPISQALKSRPDSVKIASLLECLAVATFVGGNPEETESSMQIMWQLVHPKQNSYVVASVVSAWSFLLTSVNGRSLSSKDWQQSISYFSSLLEKDDRSVRIAAGGALAVIFEMGSIEKFSIEYSNDSTRDEDQFMGFLHMHGLMSKIVNQVQELSSEAGGKGLNKKDLNSQRKFFKDVLNFLKDGHSPERCMKIGKDSLSTSTWSQLIQFNYLKRYLGGGFIKHMQDNEFLHDVFGFAPTPRMLLSNPENRLTSTEKRLSKSPNSTASKARTQLLNKQRMLSEGKNIGRFAVDAGEDA